jgi:adenylate cyclase
VAIAGQIMLTDVTQRNLSPELKENARAVFTAVLKGATEPSTVFQMIWHHDTDDLTSGNFNVRPAATADIGSLIVNYRDNKVRMDRTRAALTVGRGEDCDIPVDESYASRIHASIKLIGDHFYLIDHSLNGTFVTLDGGEELHVRRDRLLIERSGRFALGRSLREGATGVIVFTRDRRALRAV